MDTKSYSRVAAIIFAIIAILQLVRALSGWEVTLNGGAIPIWASWLASVVAGALAYVGLIARR
jgi:lipopolysaccharide export LptBFGC system permease protein LptF